MVAAEKLVLTATHARIAGASGLPMRLTPAEIASEVGLITDYGRISQQFPFWAGIFVPVPNLRRRLLERVEAGGITVLAGKPGAGKSWELTSLAKALRRRGDVVASHYCYLEPGDPSVQRRITLNVFYGNLIAEIIDALPTLRAKNIARYAAGPNELQALLSAAAELKPARRLVVIVDGLDHIARVLRDAPGVAPEDTAIAADLLALNLPPSVSVIVGSQPGDHITALAKAGQVLTVPEWDEAAVTNFLRRVPLGKLLHRRRLKPEALARFKRDLRNRSEGNALYCTYLCRKVVQRLKDDPGADALTTLAQLPPSAGALASYYEFLFASLDAGGAMVADAMGLIDFGVTPAEIAEIFPAYQAGLPHILHQLAPILQETRGQGGLRIYHESFRRHILDRANQRGDRIGAKLKDVIAWLESRGFMDDSRAYRFLLPNLVRADRQADVMARIDINFVAASCAAGHSATAIEANLMLFANLAARIPDFPMLVRAIELFRSLSACIDPAVHRHLVPPAHRLRSRGGGMATRTVHHRRRRQLRLSAGGRAGLLGRTGRGFLGRLAAPLGDDRRGPRGHRVDPFAADAAGAAVRDRPAGGRGRTSAARRRGAWRRPAPASRGLCPVAGIRDGAWLCAAGGHAGCQLSRTQRGSFPPRARATVHAGALG